MVQVLPQNDFGAQIGQQLGSGFGEILQQKARQQQIGGALDKAMQSLKPQENGQQPSFFDALSSLVPVLSSVPGGMQALGELSPVLRQELLRQGLENRDKQGRNVEIEEEKVSLNEPRTESPEEYTSRRTAELREQGFMPQEALKQVQGEMQLTAAEQQRKTTEEKNVQDFFDSRLADTFKSDLDPALVPGMRNKFMTLYKQGLSPDQAYEGLYKQYRAAQNELVELQNVPGRDFLGDARESINQARGLLPKLIEMDPELAKSQLINELDFGEGEASLAVKPGTESFKQFSKNLQEAWEKPQRQLSEKYTVAGMAPLADPSLPPKQRQELQEKQLKRLEKFLKSNFDTDKDSLLGLRYESIPAGITDEMFLQAVNNVYPDSANNENLSDFTRNEVPKLYQPSVPGLMEIFRGLGKGIFTPLKRKTAASIRGKR